MTRLAMLAGFVALFAAVPASADDSDTNPLVRQVRELRNEIAALRDAQQRDARATAAEMRLLHERLDRMEGIMDRMAKRGPVSTFKRSVRTGTLVLDNRLGVNAYATVNGVSYAVAPFSIRRVPLAPGSIGYTLTADGRGVRPLVQSSLAAGGTLTIKIF